MRRTPLLLAIVAIVATALPSSAAAPVLDGKKTRSFTFKQAVSDPQQHVLAETVGNPVDAEVTTECVAPRCYAFPFTVKPAKGVPVLTTALSAEVSWTLPTSRFWVKLMDVTKKTPVEKTACQTFYVTGGTHAVLRMKSVKPGNKYAIWVTVQQLAAPDTLSGTVAYPGTHTPKANPGPFPTELFVHGCNM